MDIKLKMNYFKDFIFFCNIIYVSFVSHTEPTVSTSFKCLYRERNVIMKKIMIIFLSTAIVLSFTACKKAPNAQESTTQENDKAVISENIGMPSPLIDCNTMEEAEKLAGFTMSLPKNLPEGYSIKLIQAIKDKLIQVFYENGDDELLIRKAVGKEDISGDYNNYPENQSITVNGVTVETKGSNGKVNVATWTDGDYSYSISFQPETAGVDTDVIKDMVENIH